MANLKSLTNKIVPVLVIFSSLLFAGSVSFAFAPKATRIVEAPKEKVVLKKDEVNFSPFSMHSPEPKAVLGVNTGIVSPTITPTATPRFSALPTTTPTVTPAQTIVVHTITQAVSSPVPSPTPETTPLPSPSISPSPTPAPSLVSIEINSPAGKSNFNIELNDGATACEILQKAKDEGKITSLTLDDKYLESFGTLLVAEMNGFSNGWVFTVNGESPMGCSLSFPGENDIIVWNYVAF